MRLSQKFISFGAFVLLLTMLSMTFLLACNEVTPENPQTPPTTDQTSPNNPSVPDNETNPETPDSTDLSNYTFYPSADKTSYTLVAATPSACSSIILPAFYNNLPVTAIGTYAFYGCSDVTSIIIPDSIKTIGDYAFENCTGLTSVTIGNGVENIGNFAFSDCKGLTSVTIPDSVTGIGDRAFYGCTGLTSITIGNGVESIGSWAFKDCFRLTSITIPPNITQIHDDAFEGCHRLVEIYNLSTLPISVGNASTDQIGCYVKNVYTLTSGASKMHTVNDFIFYADENKAYLMGYTGKDTALTLPDGYEGKNYAIHQYAFAYTDLTSVTIPDSVTTIGTHAFISCSKLTSVSIGNGVEIIGDSAFKDCAGLTSVTIPPNITQIQDDAFTRCYRLVEVYNLSTLPIDAGSYSNGSIGAYAEEIHTDATAASKVHTVNDYIFYYERWHIIHLLGYIGGNTVLNLPDDCDGQYYAIKGYAFYGYSDLTSVTISDKVTSIGDYAFEDCSKLASVTISEAVTRIGYYAFKNCTSLASITIPDNVKGIMGGTFYGCTGLTSITIGNGVKSIGFSAFEDCIGLTSITIPPNVTEIHDTAFHGCSRLAEIYNLSTLPISVGATSNGHIGYYAKNVYTPTSGASKMHTVNDFIFYADENEVYLMGYTGKDTTLTLPDGYEGKNYAIYQYAFVYTDLTSVTIPDSVTDIGQAAFGGCAKLLSVTIPNGVTSIGKFAFALCPQLRSITIPDSVTSICEYAFGECLKLLSINIGSGLTSLDIDAFRYCNNLNSIVVDKNNTTYYSSGNCLIETATGTLMLGCMNSVIPTDGTIICINKHAFYDCDITSIIIPNSVTSIESAFYSCSRLTSVYYTGTPEEWDAISIHSIDGDNSYLTTATRYYYSETEPDYTDGNHYWHYVDGVATPWVQA